MEKYDNYKDSGIEWIGEVPNDWNVKKIKHRCYVKARVGWKGLKSDEFLSDGYSYLVTGSDFKKDKVIWKDCYHIDQKRYDEDPYIQLQDEDLLITKDGTIGKLAIVKGLDKPACLNSGIFVVRSTKADFSTEFLFWVLKSKVFTQFNEYTSYGSTIQHLYQNVFVEFAYPFPTPEEQTAIANYLDRKTTEIDELIADKKRLLELYEEEKTAIINQAVTKGINLDVPMKNSGIEWLGEIPEHWEVLPIKYTANVQTGRTPKIANSDIDFFENGDTNWYTPGDFDGNEILKESKRKIISEAFEKNQVELFPKQSIYLVSIGATIGKVSLSESEASANQQINIISFNKEKVIPHWGYYFIVGNKEMVLNEADYTTLPILNQTKLKNIWIAFPNIDEQKNIIAHVNNELDRLRLKVGNTKKLIDLLTEYRTALISEVVTGKIKVTE